MFWSPNEKVKTLKEKMQVEHMLRQALAALQVPETTYA